MSAARIRVALRPTVPLVDCAHIAYGATSTRIRPRPAPGGTSPFMLQLTGDRSP